MKCVKCRKYKKNERKIGTYIVVVALVLLIVLPMLNLLIWTVTERWAWPDLLPQVYSVRAIEEIFGRRGELLKLLGSSAMISASVGVLSIGVGMMTARALTCYKFWGRDALYFLSLLPFLVPATVFAMGIQITFLKWGLGNSVAGVILVHLICSLPYAVRLLMDGMRAVGTKLEEQAQVLGAAPFRAFFTVTLPLLTPVILSALSMSYIVSFSQYFLTLLIGGGTVKTFTIVMVPYLQSDSRNIACVYSTAFLAITLLVFGVFEWLIRCWSKGNVVEYDFG